jgi:hypothetical protein
MKTALALPTGIRLEWKLEVLKNALAYITSGVCTIKLFMTVNFVV